MLVVTGCSSAQPVTPAQPPVVSGTAAAATADTVLSEAAHALAIPSSRYLTGRRLLFEAELEFTRRCMLGQGLTYPAARPDQTGGDSEWAPNLQVRRSRGYGLDPASQPSPDSWLRALSAAERAKHVRALKGDPSRRATYEMRDGTRFNFAATGCIAQSRIELYGNVVDAARVSYVPQGAHQAVLGRISADRRVRDAVARWSACMRDRGFAVASAQEARNLAAQAYDAARRAGRDLSSARTTEIRIATADADCAMTADLSRVAEQVGRRYANELPADQRRELNIVAVLWNSALRRATG